MKLLRCYIENYGTLSRFRFEFNDRLTVINEENGFGKSTLCSFIMAMFYGLPQTTKRKVEENERKLRAPWQGGNFGGTLEVEINGKEYRIERFFGTKANDDTFRLFDLSNGAESSDYSENIGVEVFGIDAEGFKRSVFFPQLESETSVNTSITAKLMNLVENSDDMTNYDKAMSVLKKRKNDYSTGRGKGFVPELKEKCTEAERRLNDARVAAENITELSKRLKESESAVSEREAELRKVREDLSLASDSAAAMATKKRKDELKAEIKSLETELKKTALIYPNGLPDESELADAFKNAEELKSVVNEYRILKNNTAETEELNRLKSIFDGKDINGELIEKARGKSVELAELKVKCDTKSEYLKTLSEEETVGQKPPVKLLCILSAVLGAVGCAMLFVNITVAVIVIVLGVFSSFAAAFLYLKNMIDRNTPKTDTVTIKQEYEVLKREVDSTASELQAFFAEFDLEGSFSDKAYRLKAMWNEYLKLQKSVAEKEAMCSEVFGRLQRTKQELDTVLGRFGIVAEGGDYYSLLLKMRDAGRAEQQLTQSSEAARKRLGELPDVDEKVTETSFDREALADKEKALGQEVDRLRKTALEFKNRIAVLLPMADAVPELENELATFKEQLADRESELFTIEKTMEFLEIAKSGLSSKYRDPMSEGFKKYADIMLGEDVGGFLLDPEFNVNIERHGKAFEKDYFSTGYKDLLDIATRFALCDALYDDVKPPVVLDDPFVNLDERKLENALGLLQKLAEDRQIIYLTCHISRVPQ